MSKDTISLNLRRIRGSKELTQDSVAKKAGISVPAYRKIEKGISIPRVSTLQAISQALGIKLQDLVTPVEPLRAVRFRANKSMKARDQILAEVFQWLKDFNDIEDRVGEKTVYLLADVAEKALTENAKYNNPLRVAMRAREALGLESDECIRNICGLLESAGIKLYRYKLSSNSFFGLCVGNDDGGPAVVVNVWDRIPVERWIFSAAHELGHLLLHHEAFDVNEKAENKIEETEADLFASHFLMPDELFRKEWEAARGLPLVPRVMKIKRIFKVSYGTVLYRLIEEKKADKRLWSIFKNQYRSMYGKKLPAKEERFPADHKAFSSTPEPEGLSPSDFSGDRLRRLVRKAIEEEKISQSRGAEILRVKLDFMREWAASWSEWI